MTSTGRFVLLLGGMTAFGPLSIDMYLPAFPEMATALHTGEAQVQLTLTLFLVGLAVGQIVAGPLSDSFGRKRPLLFGLALYVVSSLVCAIAPSVYALAGLRIVQGLAAAAGLVIARAAVRDRYSGTGMAKFLSTLMLVSGLAPILAPVIGGQVLRFTSWAGVFVVLAGFGALLLIACALWLPETLPHERRHPPHLGTTLRHYGRLLVDRSFLGYAISSGLVFAAMFSYIAGSSFVLQDIYRLNPQQYSLVFGVNALGIMALGQLNGLLLRRYQPARLLVIGLVLCAVSGVGVLVAALAGLGLAGLLPTLFLTVASIGMVMPNATAMAMADQAESAGTASALLGVLQFIVGGLAAPLIGLAGTGTAVPMGVVIAALAVGSLLVFVLTVRSTVRTKENQPA